MPIIDSAKKRMRQNVTRRLRNRGRRSQMRTEVRKFRELVEEKKFDEAREELKAVYRVIDRTSQNGAIHSNTASRYKSRLTRYLNSQAAAD